MKRPRILEIGDASVFKRALPDQTTLLWSGQRPPADLEHRLFRITDLPDWLRRIRRADYDLVAVHARRLRLWRSGSSLRQNLGRAMRCAQTGWRELAGELVRVPFATPILFADFSDESYIAPHNFPALDRCRVSFKRELPCGAERVLLSPHSGDRPDDRRYSSERRASWAEKIHPISLGLSASRAGSAGAGVADAEKTTDIFWAGSLSNDLRRRGLERLQRLSADGYRVDIAPETVPHDEFMRRCARAWLVWSPQGQGWDCFRHYEAAAAGSVAVINTPTIRCFQPLVEGEHCVYYAGEGDGLERVVRHALSDRDRLRRMAGAARAHVLRHHTHAALAAHMLAAVLDPTQFDLSAGQHGHAP